MTSKRQQLARDWVESHCTVVAGSYKDSLMRAFSAGFGAGMEEADEVISQLVDAFLQFARAAGMPEDSEPMQQLRSLVAHE